MPWFHIVTERHYEVPGADAEDAKRLFVSMDGDKRGHFQVKGTGEVRVGPSTMRGDT